MRHVFIYDVYLFIYVYIYILEFIFIKRTQKHHEDIFIQYFLFFEMVLMRRIGGLLSFD